MSRSQDMLVWIKSLRYLSLTSEIDLSSELQWLHEFQCLTFWVICDHWRTHPISLLRRYHQKQNVPTVTSSLLCWWRRKDVSSIKRWWHQRSRHASHVSEKKNLPKNVFRNFSQNPAMYAVNFDWSRRDRSNLWRKRAETIDRGEDVFRK